MRLDQALVLRKLCESRNEAQECISVGHVLVNGVVCMKQTKQVNDADILLVTERRNFVSRGGEKLRGALSTTFGDDDSIRSNISDLRAIDIGSSTGGFTDCLLKYGVQHIDAVDVGTNQLHTSLQNHPNISLYENTDIRNFTGTGYDIIVADLSFIPLNQVLSTIFSFGKNGSYYFLLIKPQFEVGKGNTKKGIVKNPKLIEQVLTTYKSLVPETQYKQIAISPCIIQGGDGNQEYFLTFRKYS
jgi:23S rRNA (cytidine1920-2'-O)/16S rRNA (cytidine1409-2'-O)-methyltransferase